MRKLSIVLLIFLAHFATYAQEATQYFMTSLPQVSINNPAFIPRYNYSIGLPGLSSIYAGYSNNGFSYNDLISKSNGDVIADFPKLTKALADKNYVTTSSSIELIRVGIRLNPAWYIQASATAREYARVLIPREAVSLFADGTASMVGTSTTFSPRGEGLTFLESALSAAFQANDRLTVGARLKYLNGLSGATTTASSMNVAIASNYALTASADFRMNTSGIHDPDQQKKFFSNSGFGVDLGATLKVTDRLTVAASLVDIGSITWKNDLYSYTLDKATAQYTFSGVSLKDVLAGGNYLGDNTDSIKNKFDPKESQTGSFSTPLPLKLFVSGSYDLGRDLSVGGLFFAESFHERVSPGVSASLSKHVGKWLSATASYTVSNRSYNNLGLGVSFNVKPVQIYFVGDNLLRMPVSLVTSQQINDYVNSTKLFNLRVGLNFVWGRDPSLDKLSRNTKAYNKKGKANRERVTDGNADYLKVRKKRK